MTAGDIIEVEIADIAYRGRGVARVDGAVVFVRGVAPGEKVLARITSAKKNFYEAEAESILVASPARIPDCTLLPDGNPTPGCVYGHLDYAAEVAVKNGQLQNFFRKFQLPPELFEAPFASPHSLRYRNKSVFHIARSGNSVKIGYVGDDNRTVADIEECVLSHPEINASLREARRRLLKSPGRHESLTIRFTEKDGAVWWTDRAGKNAAWLTEKTSFGEVSVPPDGFFQVNPEVAAELVRCVSVWIREAGVESKSVLDCYCGVGVFGFALASCGASHVLGVESGRNAIEAAKKNAERLGFANCRFVCATAAEAAKKKLLGGFDFAVVDPPRGGMERETVDALISASPVNIVYVSCDPATLTRDLAFFLSAGYDIRKVRMFDMFPRTMHFESAVLLSKKQA